MEGRSNVSTLGIAAGLGVGISALGYIAFRDTESTASSTLRKGEEDELIVTLNASLEGSRAEVAVMPNVIGLLMNLMKAETLGLSVHNPVIADSCLLLKRAAEEQLLTTITKTTQATSQTKIESDSNEVGSPKRIDETAQYADGETLIRSISVAKDCRFAYQKNRYISWVIPCCVTTDSIGVDATLIRDAERLVAMIHEGKDKKGVATVLRLAKAAVPFHLLCLGLGFMRVQTEQTLLGMFPEMVEAADAEGLAGVNGQVAKIVFTFCVSRALDVASSTFSFFSTSRFTCSLRTLIVQRCLGQDYEFFDKNTSHLSHEIEDDIKAINSSLFDSPLDLVQSFTRLAVSTNAIYRASPRLFLPSLAPLPFAFIFASILIGFFSDEEQQQGTSLDVLRNIKTVRECVMEREEGRRREVRETEFRRRALRSSFVSSCMTTLFYSVLGAQILGMYYAGCKMYLRNEVGGGELQTLVMNALTLFGSVPVCMASVQNIYAVMVPINSLARILDTTPKIEPPTIDFINSFAHKAVVFPEASSAIKFENVSFQYPSTVDGLRAKTDGDYVLKNVSFEVLPGEHVALVGGVGSGKSTVIKLVERFYDPTDGQVNIFGQAISSYNVHDLRSQMAVVAQDSVLLGNTIKEAITYGLLDIPSDADVTKACVSTGAWSFISEFKDGLHTRVSGGQLSGGQRQCLCITRAVLRRPNVLLLDEATSSLDSVSEKLVQDGIDGLLGNADGEGENGSGTKRTTISVAHRLQTIVGCDRIIVLNQGSVAEQGTHAELMDIAVKCCESTGQLQEGFYRTLYETQMRHGGGGDASDTTQKMISLQKENAKLKRLLGEEK